MKRILTVLLACLLLLPALVACSSVIAETKDVPKTNGKTSEEKEEMISSKNDGEMNLIFIGNSNCYYWIDELWGLMDAAGYKKLTVCNVYYSGCKFSQHWEWLRGNEANYEFFYMTSEGRRSVKNVDLQYCLNYKNWDAITFCHSQGVIYREGEEAYKKTVSSYFPQILKYVQEKFPEADYYYQQLWTEELGKSVKTEEEQREYTKIHARVAKETAEENNIGWAPMGNAWDLVRFNPVIYEGGKNMTTRIFLGKPNHDDLGHDGDVGGGQYLNACVMFETLTGISCLENTFRPHYEFEGQDLSLSEEKIAVLKKAAHQAVAEDYGEDFAK